ncbi:RidA family protein [Sphingomonas sp. Leaf208]|uniref:RidA family protein n=1 Tax=Sphingomonas sp. Leaf208 TaxID=1735679 RepID=UPI001F1B8644|nr:RidA family protein [Sphingomonas sp. Leaf208]
MAFVSAGYKADLVVITLASVSHSHQTPKWRKTMTRQQLVTTPDNYAPFLLSQGIRHGDLLFISGQAGADDDGKIVEGGFRAQGRQAFANLRRALEAGGSSLHDVIKVTIFVTDMSNFRDVVELRREFFSAPYPADTIAEVRGLYDPAVMIEIEAIAAVHDEEK